MAVPKEQQPRPIYLVLPPEHIARLKFTIESYEGLGVVRTHDPQRGEVVILALEDTESIVREVLRSLEGQFPFREVDPPTTLKGDWLLAELWAGQEEPSN